MDAKIEYESRPPQKRARIRYQPLSGVDPDDMPKHAYVLRTFSIAEAFTDTLCIDLIRTANKAPDLLLESMIREIDETASRSWASRGQAFKRLHGVSFSSISSWKQMSAAQHLRNAIAHGLGQMTASQRHMEGLTKQFQSIDVTIAGGAVVITDSSLVKISSAVRSYVTELDEKLGPI